MARSAPAVTAPPAASAGSAAAAQLAQYALSSRPMARSDAVSLRAFSPATSDSSARHATATPAAGNAGAATMSSTREGADEAPPPLPPTDTCS